MTLANLSKERLTEEEFNATLKLIASESDRGCAIMGAALVESALKTVLDASVVHGQDEDALYYDQGAPFGTLKNKTVVALALGLIDKSAESDIDTIRIIRNQFSHALRPLDFRNPRIDTACKKLVHRLGGLVSANIPWGAGSARHAYQIACSDLFQVILTKASSIYVETNKRLENRTAELLANARLKSAPKKGGN